MSAPYVAVCGPSEASADVEEAAEEVGRRLALGGAIVVCGGRGGAMAAACRGAAGAGGVTVGLLPGSDRGEANEWVSIALPTGLGEMRNALIVRAADVVVALRGGWGTLSEVALARRAGTPVVGLGDWDLEGIEVAPDAASAAERALALARH